jgi:hypothetical protein
VLWCWCWCWCCCNVCSSVSESSVRMGEDDEIKNWEINRGDVQRQRTKDPINILILLLVHFIVHRKIYRPIIEAPYILSTTAPFFYRINSAASIVPLNRWKEMQENGRRCQQTLKRPGLAFSSLILFCFLCVWFPVILKCLYILATI